MKTYTKKMLNIISETDVPKKLTSSTPAKISIHQDRAFSLPAGKDFSCPGETKACAGCYARKGRFLFDNVETAYAKNLILIRQLLKERKYEELSTALLKVVPEKAKIFRIHASGDFINQNYVNAWAEVIKQRQHTLFWAYTRSFKLNFSPLTKYKNFTLWASTDQYNIKQAKKFIRRYRKSGAKHAYGPWKHDTAVPKNSFICPQTSGKLETRGACEKCMLCVVKKRVNKNVVFLEH